MPFVLTFNLKPEKWQIDRLNKRMEISRGIYNSCLGELYKRHRALSQDRTYIYTASKITEINKRLKTIEGNKKEQIKYNALLKERNCLYKTLYALYKQFGLTEYSLHSFVKPMQNHFKSNIDSNTAQKIATRCFNGFKKLLNGEAEKIHFKKYGQLNSIEGKNNSSGIRFKDGKIHWLSLKIPAIINKNDQYAQEVLLNKVKYCRIVREIVRGRHQYYVQLVLDGNPPIKTDKTTGQIKYPLGEGRVGIDIGTQTYAISSMKEAKLMELAPTIQNIQNKITKCQRKLDRSTRATNPDNFKADGRVKRGEKLIWCRSKRYLKTLCELKELYRKQAAIRRLSHNIQTNQLLTLGDEFYVEDMNFKALAKRAKKTEKSKKTGKYKSKKRFGKSIANKAPSMFISILEYKIEHRGGKLIKVDPKKIKASQYNHIDGTYKKKSLSQRWNDFNEFRIQRDLYSSFLLMCTDKNQYKTNRSLCNKHFDNFKILHDIEINRLKNDTTKKLSSMGL